jgi:hypothetical protein
MEPHVISASNAKLVTEYLKTRGGIALWKSINLSNIGATWMSPTLTEDGKPYPKPSWQAESTPSRVITEAREILVAVDVEVKRFRVGVERGGMFSFQVTAGGSRRIRREVSKAGENAYHVFDYATQEAVILRPESLTPLSEWRTP